MQINNYAPLRATATLLGRLGLSGRSLVIAVPTLWLFVFLLIPFFVVAKISLSKAAISQPPFLPLYEWTSDGALKFNVFFSNYQFLFSDPLYVNAIQLDQNRPDIDHHCAFDRLPNCLPHRAQLGNRGATCC